jgi:hypothetical protein
MQNIDPLDIRRLKFTLESIREKYDLQYPDIINLVNSDKSIPLDIFSKKLTPLETIVKFLRENKKKKFKEIAQILNKKIPACWNAYKDSTRKSAEPFSPFPSEYDIPIKELHSKKLSLLEILSVHLKSKNLSYRKIGQLLDRNERTVWTAYQRALKKRGNK